ncbi:peroxiredoxin [Candidatus Carsonella ruddii]|uniref:Alkyl hydroperoxide reductase C n=1 Tax=Candidatus Carsonella ruddii PC isolate NHV TaxID=1202540 RepID=J3TWK1_CARRU|nr:peroxiredoxin [Candidatus Carsonella ruddii]AFP84340.1 alkyl hydroperoxide reductase [Candidatus Carsonella ruddii PC isolate NHV]
MLNTKINSFKSIAYFKKKFFEITDKELKNFWNVLFFFPFSYTYICPTELLELSKNINLFKNLKCNIYAISTDSHYTHKNWIENEINFINFPFISDFNHKISKNYKILNKNDGNCYRSTFIIDPNLIIKSIEIIDISISRSIQEILNKIKMLIFTFKNKNKLCPYNWLKDNNSIDINL